MERRSIMRRAFVFIVLACFCFSIAVTSCVLPDPKTVAELTELKSNVKLLGEELIESKDYVLKVKKDISDVIEKGKAGQLTVAEVSGLLETLNTRLNEGEKRLSDTKEAFSATQQKIKELSESGVPWWQIAIWIILGGLNVATGKGYLKEKGNGQIADYAIGGIGKMVKFMEDVYIKGGTVKDVKKKIATLNHDLIEAEVMKLPSSPAPPPPKEGPLPPKT